MYRCVVTPVDGSIFGEHALPYAAAVARSCDAVLHVTHVHVPLIAPSGVETMTFRGAWEEATRTERRDYLADLSIRLRRQTGVQIETSLIEGPVAAAIGEHARKCEAGLLVMSTHAHLRLSRLWHHGVAEQVSRSVPIPVLLVHPPAESAEPDLAVTPEIRHILVPLDGTSYAEAMLEHAATLAGAVGARFTLLEVIRPEFAIGYTLLAQPGHVNEHRLSRDRRAAESYLAEQAESLRRRGFQVDTRVEVSEEPAAAIVDFARRSADDDPIDLIALETHPHRPIARILGAHTADIVIHDAPTPVLIYEPSAEPVTNPSTPAAAAEPLP